MFENICSYAKKYNKVCNDKIGFSLVNIFMALISSLVLLELAEDWFETGSWIFDSAAVNYVYSIRSSTLNNTFKIITSTGNVAMVIAITLAIAIVLVYLKKKKEALLFTSNVMGLWIFNEVLKAVFKRPRPLGEWLVSATGYSFPSGHAMTFMGLSLLLGYYFLSFMKSRLMAAALTFMIINYSVFVGLSRVYVGVHYLSDVLGGWAGAMLWLSLTSSGYKKLVLRENL